MDTYLTKKSRRKRPWEYPIFAFMAIIIYATIETAVSFVLERNLSTASVSIILLALELWPVVHMIRRRIHCSQAAKVSVGLRSVSIERLSFERLELMLHLSNPEKKIAYLVDHGFLQDMRIDWENRCLVLTLPMQEVRQERLVKVVCSGCGAENLIHVGRVGVCEYCGTKLMYRE
ncbi:MAG: hypothetical protein Q4B01_02785 [Eubacteriales bacterium]|nr:hypothetical protein [Eubacteriales bacterium]